MGMHFSIFMHGLFPIDIARICIGTISLGFISSHMPKEIVYIVTWGSNCLRPLHWRLAGVAFLGLKTRRLRRLNCQTKSWTITPKVNGNSSSIRPTFSWHANGLEKFPAIVIANWDFLATFRVLPWISLEWTNIPYLDILSWKNIYIIRNSLFYFPTRSIFIFFDLIIIVCLCDIA